MKIKLNSTKFELGRRAAADGAGCIRDAITARGQANVVVATGKSQLEMLAELVRQPNVDWTKVVFFHLDDYVGLPKDHPASFQKYLTERLVQRLPKPPKAFHFLDGDAETAAECRRVGDLIRQHPIDVAFLGIGENGHLAFNDPPANFETEEPFLQVTLDEPCRKQQFGEGWFQSLDEVPKHAITMSIRQILTANRIVCSVPDRRKADAVRNAVQGPVTPDVPASILQTHAQATIYLDPPAASMLATLS
jgi:glucosamine-6-phosphate deaminase